MRSGSDWATNGFSSIRALQQRTDEVLQGHTGKIRTILQGQPVGRQIRSGRTGVAPEKVQSDDLRRRQPGHGAGAADLFPHDQGSRLFLAHEAGFLYHANLDPYVYL